MRLNVPSWKRLEKRRDNSSYSSRASMMRILRMTKVLKKSRRWRLHQQTAKFCPGREVRSSTQHPRLQESLRMSRPLRRVIQQLQHFLGLPPMEKAGILSSRNSINPMKCRLPPQAPLLHCLPHQQQARCLQIHFTA